MRSHKTPGATSTAAAVFGGWSKAQFTQATGADEVVFLEYIDNPSNGFFLCR
jgi:hypothetical protein